MQYYVGNATAGPSSQIRSVEPMVEVSPVDDNDFLVRFPPVFSLFPPFWPHFPRFLDRSGTAVRNFDRNLGRFDGYFAIFWHI